MSKQFYAGATLDGVCLLASCLGKPQLTAMLCVNFKVAGVIRPYRAK